MAGKGKSRLDVDLLPGTARDRLEDAKALIGAARWGGASYMCGYAVELGLKWKIGATLNWKEYPEAGLEHKFTQALETHNLNELLVMSGKASELKNDGSVFPSWSTISDWGSEQRYQPKDMTTPEQAKADVDAASVVLDYLLGT